MKFDRIIFLFLVDFWFDFFIFLSRRSRCRRHGYLLHKLPKKYRLIFFNNLFIQNTVHQSFE